MADLSLNEIILERAEQDFFKWGIRNVSMDKLAEELGISKRTLYEHFSSKDDIIVQIIRHNYGRMMSSFKAQCDKIETGECNSVEVLCYFITITAKEKKRISPMFFKDLCKYYPHINKSCFADLENNNKQLWLKVYEAAKEEGFLRKEIDIFLIHDFISDIMSDKLNYVSSGKYTIDKLHMSIINPFARGCLTPKGRHQITEYLKHSESKLYKEILNKLTI